MINYGKGSQKGQLYRQSFEKRKKNQKKKLIPIK